MTTKKILLLWSPLADYSVACLHELAGRPGVELYLVYHPGDPNAPYTDLDVSFCRQVLPYSELPPAALEQFCYDLQPDTVLMASWNYRLYMKITRRLRQQGSYVVSVFDRQWEGKPKQWLGVLTSKLFLKPSIDNFFVAGDRQATFARKLGYGNPYLGYYCANTDRFAPATSGPRNFVFVGRLVEDKGVAALLEAYARYRASTPEPWGLLLCGKGPLESRCQGQPGVQVLGFAQPAELPARLAQASCLVLPSRFEPWGLVVHEAVAAGLAVIASHEVGAATYFVRDGQNGYLINPDADSLTRALRLVAEAGELRLTAMRQTSQELAALWTLDKWADYVYDNICQRHNQVRQLAPA